MAKTEKQFNPKEILREFSENATPHGPGLIANSKTTVGKLISVCILLTCTGAAVVNIGFQLNSFFKFQYKDTIQVDNVVIEMPSVTICPTLGFSRMKYISYNFSGETSVNIWSAIPINYQLLKDHSHENFSQFEDLFITGSIALDNMLTEDRLDVGHDLDGLIIKCRFAGRDCNTSHFGQFLHPELNHCYTFNGKDVNMDIDTRIKASTTDAGLHLKIFLDAFIPEILPYGSYFNEDVITSGNIGLRVTVHPKDTITFPKATGFDIPPGYASTITLKQHKIERLGLPYSECTNRKLLEGTKYAYTQAGCQAQCFQKNLMKTCGCVSSWHPIPPNNTLKICTKLDSENIYKEMVYFMNLSTSRGNMDILSKDFTHLGCLTKTVNEKMETPLNCEECLPACKEISYSKSISQAYWPDEVIQGFILKMILQSPERNTRGQQMIQKYINFSEIERNHYQITNRTHADTIRKNMVSLSISFGDLSTEVTKQKVEYEGAQLLCDIGGALGLYIGVSFISLCEVGKLLMRLLRYAFCRTSTSRIEATSAEN
ncbi:unnamed protein product [Owenia fusiformis]|uniref:Uncharacterized protein n=1 Tax=Owenia fusiformis TaxID=6347 RepID=A0A8J1V141_OWEFU|nr:unnamed protein product [Owenia fusiformis]